MKYWNLKRPDESIINSLRTNGELETFLSGLYKSNNVDINNQERFDSLVSAVLVARGFESIETISEFFEPHTLSDPFFLKDMDKAVERINLAIDNGEKICIYGDYDCDGIMSTVMLYTFLNEIGADVFYYIPERSEGYGLNSDAVRKIASLNANLIITVDNGISALNEAELIYELGMQMIVTDHHQVGEVLPRAEAVVDPHRMDCFAPFRNLCGAGVVLKLISAMLYGDYTIPLEQYSDLTSIATVADIVELSDENRYIVHRGLGFIENNDRIGLNALITVSGLSNRKITSKSIAFFIAPRINASGRFGSPKTAVKLLLSEDEKEALEIASELNILNENRKKEENIIMNEIIKMADNDRNLVLKRVLFFVGKNWSHGVIGIVASKIEELYGKPCFIASESNGEIRGSARAFGDFSVFEALDYCKDYLEKFGGHKGAGGFTIKNGMAEEFDNKLQEYAFINFKTMPVFSYDIDYVLKPEDITIPSIKGLEFIEPCGFGNSTPVFMINGAVVEEISPMSSGIHTRLKIRYGNKVMYAKMFRRSPEQMGISRGDIYSFAVNLEVSEYNGNERIEILIVDFRKSGINQSKVISAGNIYESFLRDEELPKEYYKAMYPEREDTIII
ncbi:MAG: single-stranded-DNA-specific exonuclease RecJ, partial [Oscillospiraceae bacterium]|nr:single-stranded-DNA-specific exonuclease RecJ [Oscillospiraceae bacterium]